MQLSPKKPLRNSLREPKVRDSNASYFPSIFLFYILLFVDGFPGYTQTETFTNPIRDGADPWVIQKEGVNYYCSTAGNGIFVSMSETLTEGGDKIKVWSTPGKGWNHSNVWAPELHFIDSHWYIYYTAGKVSGSPFIHQRSGVLRSISDDPFGPYEDLGMLYTGDDIEDQASHKWAIDLTPWEHEGQLYAVWSGWEENRKTDRTKQHLYIAKMSDPVTISSNRVKISSPEEVWETGGKLDLNEGPQLLKNKNHTFIIYSTRESWLKDYRLGQLKLTHEDADPMLPESWEKSGPVFCGTDQVLGVGHCSFAKSPDGSEDWMLYHSKKTVKPGWNRNIRLQPFYWKQDGSPDFGIPIPAGVSIPLPAGEEYIKEKVELEK